MKTANTEFEGLSPEEYEKYYGMAEYLRDKGLLTDKSVIELAKQIYEKERNKK